MYGGGVKEAEHKKWVKLSCADAADITKRRAIVHPDLACSPVFQLQHNPHDGTLPCPLGDSIYLCPVVVDFTQLTTRNIAMIILGEHGILTRSHVGSDHPIWEVDRVLTVCLCEHQGY